MPIPIPLIMAAAQLVPDVIRMFKGDKQADVAEKVVDVAKVLTGNDDAAAALEAVKANPELLVQLQAQMKDIAIVQLQAEVAEQAQVNETMRAELTSDSLFKSGWRPAFGWSMSFLFSLFVAIMLIVPLYWVFKKPDNAAEVIRLTIDVINAMMMIWVAAFTVLGVNIRQRTIDKHLAAGVAPPAGLIGLLNRK